MSKTIVGCVFGFIFGVLFCCTSLLVISSSVESITYLPITSTHLPTNSLLIDTPVSISSEFPTTIPIEKGMTIVSGKMTQTFIAIPTSTQIPTITLTPKKNFDYNGDGEVTCKDFETQSRAREALEDGYSNLDREKDGNPCEDLPE